MGRKLKDSGVEWIGEIPEDWEFIPIKYVAKIQTGNTPSKADKELYSETGIDWIKTDNLIGTSGVTEATEKISEYGKNVARIAPSFSTLVCCIGSIGKMGFTTKPVAYNQQINAVTFNSQFIHWKYGMYFLASQQEQHEFYQNGNVLRILNTENQKKIIMTLPALKDQQKIIHFLDRKTTHIDSIIEKTKASIDSFKRYKQALITETVTKGLNPDMPMKDSGVEWIGMIPEHWDISKVKYLLGKKGVKIGPFGSALKSNDIKSSGPIKVYGQANLIRKDFTFGNKYIDLEKFNQLKNYEIEENDILISMMGTIGKCEIFPVGSHRGIMDSHLTKLNLCNEKVDSKFFRYSFSDSEITKVQLDLFSKGSIMSGLNSSIIKNIVVTLPPLSEQHRIVAFLDEKTAHIDRLIQNKEAMIEKLEAYKKSLIYEYVTGKKEVE